MIGETVVYLSYGGLQHPGVVLREHQPDGMGAKDLAVAYDNGGSTADILIQRMVFPATTHPEVYRQGHTWHNVDPGPVPND